ncbi:MAG: FAD-binding protein [Taibaiella sp.]|nr:FAD-binding protein [Taibaiella sp.]
MIKKILISLLPAQAADGAALKRSIADNCGVAAHRITGHKIIKHSIDARPKQPKIVLQLEVSIDEVPPLELPFTPQLNNVTNARHVVIAGAGPAGLFAALRLIELGYKPIILERGKDVRNRRRDLAAMNKEGVVNPESNYCFGEGGAGTYSDGKLYTRSTKRGDVKRILQLFHFFGAEENVLYEAHPHIGTNKLPQIITWMREQIIACGGEVLFGHKLTGIITDGDSVAGVKLADGSSISCQSLILATGHSARDIFTMLHHQGIAVESKPFALGVRIEHPQLLVDMAQYNCTIRDEHLPPASYSLVSQENGRGVFSFCMCPGGIIAPAATAPGEVVVNGWSPSKRNNPYANSGTVVSVGEADFAQYNFTGPLAAMHYQQMVEQQAYQAGGGNLVAPAQRMVDFTEGRLSATLPACSYLPGLRSSAIKDVLPPVVNAALIKAVVSFGRKMKGYFTNDAVLVATESRTSSPVRIPRDNDTLQHTQLKGLFPCAEGAGYAGGIVSAAIDGERCAEAAVKYSLI